MVNDHVKDDFKSLFDFQLRVLEDQLENLGSQMNCVAKASLQ